MSCRRIDHRRGLTLIEILISMTMTLVVLGAMMAAFRYASAEISKGRATIELSNQLRVVQELMRSDLEGVTVDMRPWAITAGPKGYFMYLEGPRRDNTAGTSPDGILGDTDDIIGMTVRTVADMGTTPGKEFHGRLNGNDVTSLAAEVMWWTGFDDRNANGVREYDEPLKIYRRQLLILPETASVPAADLAAVIQFFRNNDISMRWDGNQLIANSLEDLAKRENRFAHWPGVPGYPHVLNRAALQSVQLENLPGLDARFNGNDIMLSDVLAFDVQVYSPDAEIQNNDGIPVTPSDTQYVGIATVDLGAFVDLNYLNIPFDPTVPQFSTLPTLRSQLGYVDPIMGQVAVLDTFSNHYESNGIDDDGDGVIDQGTDGVDNDGNGAVDDNEERETLPPYPYRVSGVKVTFRAVERNTKQIRQTSIIHSFMPK
ncbi:MAG: prepilin-type N-terminal cleavage/methylation domain-containing protein [Pirellulaceae bacterium]|jgi:type II secretory pathway pseudopilin PulG|nr:prepilin-type N-terminal cleavage/methylation domain-containing protein [Pirellulaceae bacterium]